jgi:hypothetical protein
MKQIIIKAEIPLVVLDLLNGKDKLILIYGIVESFSLTWSLL